MSIPQTDIATKRIIEYTIQLIQSDPDRHLLDIFGDLKLEPNQALYGERVLQQIAAWLRTTKITVITGYDLSQTELPAITVNVANSSPSQKFLGDHGGQQFQPLDTAEREVIVPTFAPSQFTISDDRQYAYFDLPKNMPDTQKRLVIPGFSVLDGRGVEYSLGFDDIQQRPTILQFALNEQSTIDAGDFTKITIISPLRDARFRDGVMLYDEVVSVDVHGHQARNENKWLWAIAVWGLHRFRPLMASIFGMDLGAPASSDLEIDSSFQGTNVWVRRITMSSKAVWSWRGVRLQDAIGLIQHVNSERTSVNKDLV
jgi:hypothetical protein